MKFEPENKDFDYNQYMHELGGFGWQEEYYIWNLENEDNMITSPWGVAYTPKEILENGNTNLNFLISYSLGGTHKKYVRNQMKGILFQAWDKYRNKLSPAEKKSLDPNDPDLMEALRDEFEDNMDEAWKESQFGGNINKMTKEAKAEMEKREPLLKKLAGETYKKELTEDYKNNLGKLETDIKREYDKGEGHIKSKYKDKIARAKSILAQARKDAEEKNIPASCSTIESGAIHPILGSDSDKLQLSGSADGVDIR